ncbi:hypothetical protein NW762_002977 [Fusarium torreyae]|uniref:Uncharacterized protein n=1 Tax=Fusarium torreyae TaxID=1237075 RepID=A0A9W8SD08_9HYPO|nr:hypothetical protein NW762_002977 [Fusarium torreyae]
MTGPHIRQEAQVVTQTVYLPTTTYTTHVTLGVVSATATDRPVVTSQHSGDGLSSAQIGAIVGSIVGVFILAFIVVCCCCRRPRRPVKRHRSYRSSYSGSDDGWSEAWPDENWTRPVPIPVGRPTPVQFPPPVAQREQIPGGPKFPTYRAIPIPNPRRPENPPRTYWG